MPPFKTLILVVFVLAIVYQRDNIQRFAVQFTGQSRSALLKGADCAGDNLDPQTRHRRQLAEPPPKGLSDREQRAALRAKLGLSPKR